MKRYVMTRVGRGVLVQVQEGDPHLASSEPTRPLRHLLRHSPGGFEWGYGGSGPADLARSIVGDLLEQADPSPADYQRVKEKLVATLPERGGELTEDQVLEVLFDRLGEL